jgi:hypothetical protein
MITRLGVYLRRNHLGMLALFVALGGTSYAAVKLPSNSVGTAQIKANGVGSSEIKSNSITSPKVKDGSLLAKDFKAGQLPAGPKGDSGAPGATGPQGPKGATGAFGAATVVRVTASTDLADGTKASYNAFCPEGQQAIGGGARGDDTTSEATSVTSSRPAISATNTEPPNTGEGFTGWRITVSNPAGGVTTGIRPDVWVICVPAAS